MRQMVVQASESKVKGVEVFTVPGPDMLKDKLIPLNTQGAEEMAQRFGQMPARASLNRWRTQGFPIDRDGPRVRLPAVTRLKKVYTSTAAMHGWFAFINQLTEEVRGAGGVLAWRNKRRRGR